MKPPRLEIDFAHRPGRAAPLGTALLVVGAMAAAGGALVWHNAWATHAGRVASLSALRSQQANAAAAALRAVPLQPADVAHDRAAVEVARSLQTPWSDLLAALEAPPHDAVALLLVEPSSSHQSVRLTAEARHASAMLDYVAGLQGDARLSRVVLVSHQIQLQSPGMPVRFTLQAGWGNEP